MDEAVRERMRRWRASVAEGERANEAASIDRAGRRNPGLNVEASFALSRFVTSYAAQLEQEPKVPLIVRWRRTQGAA